MEGRKAIAADSSHQTVPRGTKKALTSHLWIFMNLLTYVLALDLPFLADKRKELLGGQDRKPVRTVIALVPGYQAVGFDMER